MRADGVADHPLAQNRRAIWIPVLMTSRYRMQETRRTGSRSDSGLGSDLHFGKRLGAVRR